MLADGLKARKVSPSEPRCVVAGGDKVRSLHLQGGVVLALRRAADGCLGLGFNASHVVTCSCTSRTCSPSRRLVGSAFARAAA